MKFRITHIIGKLEMAGAERVLYSLLERGRNSSIESQVITLMPGGPLERFVQELGVPIHCVGMRRGRLQSPRIGRLVKTIRQCQPNLVMTWLYHSNVLGGIATKLAGSIPLVWNVRHSHLHPRSIKLSTRIIAQLGAGLSKWLPDRIVFVSQAGMRSHIQAGYATDRSLVLPNGFDVDRFRPDLQARHDVRRELGLAPDTPLVGLIGRFHPDKDHQNFFDAAIRIHRRRPDVHFLLCGSDIEWSNRRLAEWIDRRSLRAVCHLLGLREDMARLQASLDLAVSASLSEAFPNVIGEAMACGVPCVVTDVGDSKMLVGSTGLVVPCQAADELALACLELLNLPELAWTRLSRAARQRIIDEFASHRVFPRFEALWQELCPVRQAKAA